MVKQLIVIVLCIGVISSCAPTRRLRDGQKILVKKYRNSKNFDPLIYEQIDSNYFYQEIGNCYPDRRKGNFKNFREKESNLRIKFYPGGYLRFVVFEGKPEEADPEATGTRGVIYKKSEKIKVDTQFATEVGTVHKQMFKATVEGDRIYLLDTPLYWWYTISNPMCEVYQKAEKVPEDWKKYKPDW